MPPFFFPLALLFLFLAHPGHTEICKKKEKLEKNYLHLYLTIFLNNFLTVVCMISSERLAEQTGIPRSSHVHTSTTSHPNSQCLHYHGGCWHRFSSLGHACIHTLCGLWYAALCCGIMLSFNARLRVDSQATTFSTQRQACSTA